MNNPKVTVLMPVYNAEMYLDEAIESILAQSFSDFEFLIIDDGSTDASKERVLSYSDKRIRYLENPGNLKIAKTLNRGIRLARGQYIARMDADDVSKHHRLQELVHCLDQDPVVDVVCSTIVFIDSKGRELGVWPLDREVLLQEDIRRTLPRENCLAHPAVMYRRKVIERYMYDEQSNLCEDYNLWLRMVADGKVFHKIDEPLLKYRGLESPLGDVGQKLIVALCKNARAKYRFLLSCRPRKTLFGRFALSVMKGWIRDLYQISKIELVRIIRACVIWSGGLLGLCFPKTSENGKYFFFPFYHMGGAERVHLGIVSSLSDSRSVVVFCDPSNSTFCRQDFEQSSRVFDQSRLAKTSVGKVFMIGYWARVINQTNNASVFGSNTTFFYNLIPYLKPECSGTDLIHCFGGGIEYISLPFLDFLDQRIVITRQTLADFEQQYLNAAVDIRYLKRVILIENSIDIPENFKRVRQERLSVLFAGRGDVEKRPWLVGEIAQTCAQQGLKVDFSVIGASESCIRPHHRHLCNIIGEVSEPQTYYEQADVLILPSSQEGFPLVVMEAMAFGVVPICTDVGGLRFHLKESENGYLVSNDSEQSVIQRMAEIIGLLDANRSLLEEISTKAADYALNNFKREVFDRKYAKLLNEA